MRQNKAWMFFTAGRFATVDSRGRSALTSLLSSLGIALGVTALIVILSVMNGFQMGYIDSILEVSSAHVRVHGPASELQKISVFPGVRNSFLFSEAQTMLAGRYNRQQGALLRALPEDILITDAGFARNLQLTAGTFSFDRPGSVILGAELARQLGVSVGDEVTVIAISGGSSTDLFPENALLSVRALFRTGYYEVDSSFALVSPEEGRRLLGADAEVQAAVKLLDIERDARFASLLKSQLPDTTSESWRSFNRAFFGALRVEKNMLMFLVVLIFVVVTVNIFNGMRRSVYERREEISVLTALGGSARNVQGIFLINGLGIGLSGSLTGLFCGLFLSVNINGLFALVEHLVNGVTSFLSILFASESDSTFSLFSPTYFYMMEVPVRILFPEVLAVFLFGVLSATAASWMASRAIIALKPAEVLRYE